MPPCRIGRHLILISRRPLPDLLADLPVDLFVMVVAEYGAVLYHPDIDTVKRLAPPLNEKLLTALRGRGTEPLAVGESTFTVAAGEAHRVHEAVAATGAEVNLVLDKELLVMTPGGVDKAVGLRAALDALELSPHNVVAIGDADSDLEYLQMCEASIAVANAPKTVRDQVDHVVGADEGADAG